MPTITRSSFSRRVLLAGGAGVAGALLFRASRALARNRVEEPAYRVLDRVVTPDYSYEIRRYEPRIVAETEVVTENPRAASNQGFRVLAGYIFGGNRSRTEIAMTAPVNLTASANAGSPGQEIAMTAPVSRRSQETADGRTAWILRFTMPSSWTMDTLPEPLDERVRLRELPARRFAARRFSGAPTHRTVQSRMDDLVAEITAAGYEPSGAPPLYARYDPPWTPSFLRRNEILVELR